MATSYFYQQLVTSTPATNDQQHIPVVIWGDGRIPDRTEALLGHGQSPVPAMIEAVRGLMVAGADVIAIPCNTAHAYLPDVASATGARFIDMVRETTRSAVTRYPVASRIGILGTRGTRMAGLYDIAAAEHGLITMEVNDEQQSTLVDEAIRIVKRGGNAELAARLIQRATLALQEDGADIVVAACTELPLIMNLASDVLPVLDSVQCLAEACVQEFAPAARAACHAPQLQKAR
jgi:aspartate racemase